MKIEFKTKIDNQLKAAEYWIDKVTEEILYGGAKGGGKSYLGASLIFGDALIYPETHYFIARHELNDLRKFTRATVREVFQGWGLEEEKYAKFNGQDNFYSLYNGSKVFLLACKEQPSDPLFERFGSMQMTRGWIEEGGEVAEKAKSNLWLSVGRWKNEKYGLKKKLLITANPKKGWMKRDYVEPFREGVLPEKKKYIQAFATENVYLSDDYRDTLKNEKNKVARQRLWEGSWDYDEEQNSLTTYEALSDSFSNTIVKGNNKYMTVDVARMGKDTTVFGFWEGLELYKIEVRKKQGTDETIAQAKDFAAIQRVPYSHIIIDADGIGGTVVDHMVGTRSFVAESSPIGTKEQIRLRHARVEHSLIPRTKYASLKTQCGYKIAELFNEHKISIKVEEYRDKIIEELTELLREKNVDLDGKRRLMPKENVKEALGRSPDIGDIIIYRAWFELMKEVNDEDPNDNTSEEQKDQFLMNQSNQVLNNTR